MSGVLPIARRHRTESGFYEEYKYLLTALAVTHTFSANYDQALEFNFSILQIQEKDPNEKMAVGATLNNIGLVYFKLQNFDRSIEFYERALRHKREIKDNNDLDRLLINLGLAYNSVKGYSKGLQYTQDGLASCGDHCSNEINLEGQFALGISNLGLKKLDEAEKNFLTSLELSIKVGSRRMQAESLVELAIVRKERKDIVKALEYLKESEKVSEGTGHNETLISIYREFSRIYEDVNDFKNASAYQSKYIHLKDSIYGEDLIKNIARVQTEYAERENIATIAAKEKIIEQQRALSILAAIVAILAGLLILVLQRSNRTIKRVNAQLSEAKETIQEQNKLLESKNKYLDKEVESKTEDLERANQSLKQVNDELDNFIYKTSHDIRGPLASLKGMCNVALMDVKDAIALDYLRKLDSTAERLNTILTRLLIINQINNSKLSVSKIDFNTIVGDVMLLEKKKGLPGKLNIRKQIDERVFIHSDKELVRIVLENLIDNAIKFYNDSDRVDSFVEVRIDSSEEKSVKVRVIDNGIGISESNPGKLFRMFFRASERSETGGIGLYIVKTATAKLGGKVGLLTTPEGFTEFFVVFPPYPPNPEEGKEKPSIY
ncbi:MAG TPA: tetratricopeptide repeat-containing sensor histidine kinase [Ohtaekwangia sp.]